jgi:hypothetical protein
MANLLLLEGIRPSYTAVAQDNRIMGGFLGNKVQRLLKGFAGCLGAERLLARFN